LSAIASASPDVVLSALTLPDGSGIELVRTLRLAVPKTPVIFLLENNRPHRTLLPILAGASGCLMKPVQPAQLLYAIVGAIEGWLLLPRQIRDSVSQWLERASCTALLDVLTQRQLDVAVLLAEGHPDKEIAQHPGLGTGTVHAHLAAIYKKLGLHQRADVRRKMLGPLS
jgi:DNA-binding NarL/FixJ family response regulator